MAMEKDKTDEKVERYIADAFVRKGEQETLEELAGVESVDKLRQIMDDAERRYRPVPMNRTTVRGYHQAAFQKNRLIVMLMSVAAVIAIVVFIGVQPRYSTDELYVRWHTAVPYEPVVVRGGDDVAEAQKKSLESAIALAGSGKMEEAVELLLPLTADGQPEIREDAQWQLVMVYIKSGKRNEALQILHEIVGNNGAFTKEVDELINEITKKRWF